MPHDNLTVDDVAEELSVNPETVRTWIRSGELKAMDLGGGYRISRADLNDFLERRKRPRKRKSRGEDDDSD
jgi:excisionase family DNA binding protein